MNTLQTASFILLLTMLISCGESKPDNKIREGGPVVQTGDVTQPEAMDMAFTIDTLVQHKNIAGLDSLFDAELLCRRIMNPDSINKTVLATTDALLKKIAFSSQLIHQLDSGGTHQFVKRYIHGDEQHLVFRLYLPGGTLNYQEFKLARKDRKTMLEDAYVYSSGYALSTYLGILLQLSKEQTKSNLLVEGKKITEVIDSIKTALAKKEYTAAEKEFRKIPLTVRDVRDLQVLGVRIAAGLPNRSLYQRRMEKLLDDNTSPGAYLVGMETSVQLRDYEKALEYIEMLDAEIAADSFLDYYRGLFLNRQKRYPEAEQCFERLYENFPLFGDGILARIENFLLMKKDNKARQWIKLYRSTQYNFDQVALKELLGKYPTIDQ